MGNGADDRLTALQKAADAKARGYQAQACEECGNYTLATVAGPMLRCDTCGSTWSTEHAPLATLNQATVDRLSALSCEAVDEAGIPLHSPDGC